MGTAALAWQVLLVGMAEVLWMLVFWTGLGSIAGMIAGGVAFWGLRRAGGFGFGWKWAGCLRGLAAVWLVIALGLIGGAVGFLQGALRGVEIIVLNSRFRSEVLDPVGHVGAYGVQWLDGFLASPLEPDASPDKAEAVGEILAEALERGEAELDVSRFLDRLENADTAVIDGALKRAESALRERYSIPPGGIVEAVFLALLRDLARSEIRKAVKGPLDEYGLTQGLQKFLRTLPDAARENGDPATITYQELSDHVVEYFAVPLIIAPARSFVRSQQLTCGLMIPPAVLLPLLLFWLLRVLERRRARSKSGAAPVPEALPVEPAAETPSPPPPAAGA
ncbi:MAG: hypothetical protein HYY93_11600 [Planctomycetes bacterium]|nr:hypothetical protein [Planctomycetota bacterium]